MLKGFVFSKQYWTEAVATACYTQNRSTIVNRHFKTPYVNFHRRLPNINFFHVFGCPVFIHNHKDHLGKFDEKADDAIKFSKPSIDDINMVESERYPFDEYLHHFEPSQRYQVDSKVIQYIDSYEKPEHVVIKAGASFDLNDQADQFDLNDQNDHPIAEPPSSSTEDDSTPNAVSTIQIESPSSIPSMATLVPQDIWSREKHIELVNIMGNIGTGMLTRAMAKELSAASAYE
ncbi:hypothetical protein Tco_0830543 [Tanacetum coccineum]